MITQELLNSVLNYDENTGLLTWIKSSGRARAGDAAGCHAKGSGGKTYVQIRIKGRLYYAHRLAVMIFTGEMPDKDIDHIDGNGVNNRIDNLRIVDHINNCRNQKLRSTNKSGIHGVGWDSQRGKWQVQIWVSCKKIFLGRFDNLFDAVCARKSAELKYNYHPNHGTDRPL